MVTKDIKEKNIKQMELDGRTKYIVRKPILKTKPVYSLFKRIADILLSTIAFAFCIIPMLIVALLIKLDSKGPVIYKQERLGKNSKTFTVYKFRTMDQNAEKNGAQWAQKDDNRCTKVGQFLRKTRFDELPQLINIIKGDMSIVGPRPEREIFYKEFSEYIDGFDYRLLITPGLTGYAQVNGGYDLKPEEKIIYDIEYIEKRGIFMDLKIIFDTVAVVFNHKGAF